MSTVKARIHVRLCGRGLSRGSVKGLYDG